MIYRLLLFHINYIHEKKKSPESGMLSGDYFLISLCNIYNFLAKCSSTYLIFVCFLNVNNSIASLFIMNNIPLSFH